MFEFNVLYRAENSLPVQDLFWFLNLKILMAIDNTSLSLILHPGWSTYGLATCVQSLPMVCVGQSCGLRFWTLSAATVKCWYELTAAHWTSALKSMWVVSPNTLKLQQLLHRLLLIIDVAGNEKHTKNYHHTAIHLSSLWLVLLLIIASAHKCECCSDLLA